MAKLDVRNLGDYIREQRSNANVSLRQLAKLVKGMAFLCYYGDDGIMRRVGYDADANLRRGRELRAREGRP